MKHWAARDFGRFRGWKMGENRLFCRMIGFILAKAGRKRTMRFFGILEMSSAKLQVIKKRFFLF